MSIHFSATNLHKSFQYGQPVLRGIDLAAHPGTLTVIRGAAGSGRSTLLRCLTGGYRSDQGSVQLTLPHGTVQLTNIEPRTLSWIRQQYLTIFDGVIPTAPSQTCTKLVQRFANSSPDEAVHALGRLQMAQFAEVPIGRLRPPQRKTVALAAALLAAAHVVILDNPEEAAPRHAVLDWIQELVEHGKSVIATTNESSPLFDSASHTATLTKGTLQWH